MDSKDILSQEEEQDKAVDFREILFNYLVHWKWFVASIIVAMGIAFFILARKNNVYTVTASVLMKNDKRQTFTLCGKIFRHFYIIAFRD